MGKMYAFCDHARINFTPFDDLLPRGYMNNDKDSYPSPLNETGQVYFEIYGLI